MLKKKLFNLLRPVYAEMTTAEATGAGLTALTSAVKAVYSKEVEFKAMPLLRFYQFATIKTELGVEPGLTIQMMVYNNLALGNKLTEGTKMTTQGLTGSLKPLRVYEYGNAISVSQLLLTASFDDVMASATTLLSRDYAMVLDCMLRDACLTGTNTAFARNEDGTKPANMLAMTPANKMKVSVVKDALEILSTHNAPKRAEGWICIVHPHQSRDLRDDPAWINASNYGAPQQLFNGEIGRVDDVRFIETTIMKNGASASTDPSYDATLVTTDGTKAYQAVLFGDEYYGLAVSLPVELRDAGVVDFGRERGLAWYSIMGAGILNDEYGVVIETV